MNNFHLFLLFLSMAVGLLLPGMAEIQFLLPWFLGAMLFLFFIKHPIKNLIPKWNELWPTWLVWFGFLLVMLPLLIILKPPFHRAFIILLFAPPAIGSLVVQHLLGGNDSKAMGMVTSINFSAPVLFSFVTPWFIGETMPFETTISFFIKLLYILFIPLLLSRLFFVLPALKGKGQVWAKATPYVFSGLIAVAMGPAGESLHLLEPGDLISLFGVSLALSGLAYLLPFLVPGKLPDRITHSIATGQRNTGFAMLMCLQVLPVVETLAVASYIIAQHVYNIGFFYFHRKKMGK